VRAMAAADAQLFWLSAKVPNDQFLLYAFDGTPDDIEAAVGAVRRRAVSCPELSLRAVDDSRWHYPRWEPGAVTDAQFTVRDGAGQDWQDCLDTVSRLSQLDSTEAPWRVHVFLRVAAVPGAVEGSVVVVQISHALGDGTRSSALAAALLGRERPLPPLGPPDRGFLPRRAAVAAREHRRLMREVDAGLADPPGVPRPMLSVNAGPRRAVVIRTLVIDRARLTGRTVTVGALVAVADALGGYLANRGEDISRLGAEVPISAAAAGLAYNNFRNVGVDLYPELAPAERADRITAQLAAHRRRGEHPAMRASAAAFAAVPAPVLRWGVGHFDPAARPGAVSGHTVVSSVNRGPADLAFGGHRVLLTAGYPALSPVMGLTHGVHGIGDAVAISVHADPTAVDIEDYMDRLARAVA
jgi:hypothetical protein